MPRIMICAQETVYYEQEVTVSDDELLDLKLAVDDIDRSELQEEWIDKGDIHKGSDFQITEVVPVQEEPTP